MLVPTSPRRLRGVLCAAFLGATVALEGQLTAQEFVRGDTNGDGIVSTSDGHFLLSWLFRSRIYPSCLNTADFDDNGHPNLADAVAILDFAVGGPAPASPFPAAGPDPTPTPSTLQDDLFLDCSIYGDGSTLEDPNARLEILAAADGQSGTVVLTIGLSSSQAVGGFSGTISSQGNIFADGARGEIERCGFLGCDGGQMDDLTATSDEWAHGSFRVEGGALRFQLIPSMTNARPLPANANVTPILEMAVCVKDGTAAGDYALSLSGGELADDASGRAILVPEDAAVLTVSSDVGPGEACTSAPPLPPAPQELNTTFRLDSADVNVGGEVSVPFVIEADAEIQGFAFSIDFDEQVVEAVSIEKVHEKPNGQPFGFEYFAINNENNTPGSGGVDEGFVAGSLVFSLVTREFNLPAGDNVVLSLNLRVRPGVPTGTVTEIHFMDGGAGDGEPIDNNLVAFSQPWTPETANSFVFVSAALGIIDEVSVFRRGDANNDKQIDLSDGQFVLNHLFLGGADPLCLDAADTNDDGVLDVSDPTALFRHLFLGGGPLPEPAESAGEDPTPDSLGCSTVE